MDTLEAKKKLIARYKGLGLKGKEKAILLELSYEDLEERLDRLDDAARGERSSFYARVFGRGTANEGE